MNPTIDQQQLTAALPHKSTWLIANAGSGKTKVLVDRLLRLLLSGARPGGILCLTFTVTAANEMLQRVQAVLGRWLVLDDDILDGEISALGEEPTPAKRKMARSLFLRLAEDPEGLNIHTLHGFCQSLISRFPLEIGIAPASSLIDEEQSAVLWQQLLDGVLLSEDEEDIAARDYLFLHHHELLQSDKFVPILHNLKRNSSFLTMDLQQYKQNLVSVFDLGIDGLSSEVLFDQCAKSIGRAGISNLINGLLGLSLGKTDQKFCENLIQAMADEKQPWLTGVIDVFCTKSGQIRVAPLTKSLQSKNADIKDFIDHCKSHITDYLRKEGVLKSILTSVALLRLMQKFWQEYLVYKAENALLDYDDQIALVRQLLTASSGLDWVRYKLDCRIDHVFLDEAQDTSDHQWAILRALCDDFYAGDKDRQQTLFVVGDPKQSIYRFQGADPEGFFYERASRLSRDEVTDLQLSRSYRSAQPILDMVDATFTAYGEQDFGTADATFVDIVHKSALAGRASQVILAPKLSYETNNKSARGWLSQYLARQIHGWIGQKSLPALGRMVEAGDILILFRDRKGIFADLAHQLRRLGVPVASGETSSFMEPLLVQDTVAVMRYLLSSDDDYQLACVLKSAYIGLAEDDLMRLCLDRGGMSLHDRLLSLQDDPTFQPAARWLSALRKFAEYSSINSLLGAMLHRPCPMGVSGLQALKGRFGYGVEQTLSRLENLANEFEETEVTGLQGFVDHMLYRQSQVKSRVEGAGVVRLMTIHAAKGLQAPIVVMPEVTLTPKPLRGVILHEIDGLPIVDCSGLERHEKLETARQELIKADQAEHWRLLYVAMTRAAYELHLYTAHQEPNKPSKKKTVPWRDLLNEGMVKLGAVELSDGLSFPTEGDVAFDADMPALIFDSQQSIAAPETAIQDVHSSKTEPSWLKQPVTDALLPIVVQARRRTKQASDAQGRGIALHHVLEGLCGQDRAQYPSLIKAGLQSFVGQFSPSEMDEMTDLLHHVLSDVTIATFLSESIAEVPVALADGQQRRLDCLHISDDTVTVVDFKSDQIPKAQIPAGYQQQLSEYRELLRQIFPNHKIKAGVLWLENAVFSWLD